MTRNLFLFIGLASPLMAWQPAHPAAPSIPSLTPAVQATTPDLVQRELDAQKLKLRMPIGASSASFDLSDSARRTMISSPSVLRFSDQIQLTRQDSITMRGLMDLPIASLSEVVSKMDFFTQVRFVRFGLLQINGRPQEARLYASKLYILTDEIFPRKAIEDSLTIESALAKQRSKIQQSTDKTPKVASIKEQPAPTSSSSWLPSLILLVFAGAGGYYWLVIRPQSKKTTKLTSVFYEQESTLESTEVTRNPNPVGTEPDGRDDLLNDSYTHLHSVESSAEDLSATSTTQAEPSHT
ncbi:hypothetical protein [Spirosoma sp.]|uniref:hypothetical protein n=1 Tax=Spirosoma sp. TaxID=1899569 RepID=UPI00261D7C5E|nr:hypothetical protein [Spirosoma sp.]MCX6213744.1 hypothetical protein [Spirosoma sp.]